MEPLLTPGCKREWGERRKEGGWEVGRGVVMGEGAGAVWGALAGGKRPIYKEA